MSSALAGGEKIDERIEWFELNIGWNASDHITWSMQHNNDVVGCACECIFCKESTCISTFSNFLAKEKS